MRRFYILEYLGLDDVAIKFIVLALVLLLAEALIAWKWEQANRESGKKVSPKWMLAVRIVTVAAVALVWYMTTIGSSLMEADKLLAEGKYEEALAAYAELGDNARWQQAMDQYVDAALEAGDVELAAELYERTGQYDKANELLASSVQDEFLQGDLEAAAAEMCELLSQPDGAKILLENEQLYDAVFAPGREVTLEWGQTWYIAAVEEGRILVVRRKPDSSVLNKERTDVITWKDSTLRDNLQYLRSFMRPLREAILVTQNPNLNSDHGAAVPGEDTEDYVFILTTEEMIQYLGPVAEHFAGESYWTRTPVEGSPGKWYTAAMALDADGAVQLTLSEADPTWRQPVLEAMWVDTLLLLQGWAEFD